MNRVYDLRTFEDHLYLLNPENDAKEFLSNDIYIDQSFYFTTRRPLQADDSIHTGIELDSIVRLSLASGATAETGWSERVEHGKIDLYFNSQASRIEEFIPLTPSKDTTGEEDIDFSDARHKVYENHGWVTLVAWFPLGFALLATKRYYRTKWLLMHHLHNTLGLLVVAATLITCL